MLMKLGVKQTEGIGLAINVHTLLWLPWDMPDSRKSEKGNPATV